MNERIRVREVRVIDDVEGQLGIMTSREALDVARSRGLDLILVAPNAQPPVCKIMDYGKFKYEQGKREREAAKKQRQSEMKGMTMRPGTDDHDLDFKIKNIVKFLGEGDKVKVTVRFRSREITHPEFARQNLDKIVDAVSAAGVGVVERQALMEGRQMIMILAPAREGSPAAAAVKKAAAPKPAPSPAAAPATAAIDAGEPPAADAAVPAVEPPPAENTAPAAAAEAAVIEDVPAAAAVKEEETVPAS